MPFAVRTEQMAEQRKSCVLAPDGQEAHLAPMSPLHTRKASFRIQGALGPKKVKHSLITI